MVELRTLGTLDLLDCSDGHQILSVLAQPKRVAFITYLAVAAPRGMHRRDTLLGIFWPDSSDKKARNTLNQTVFVLRRTFGQKSLIVNGETGIGLGPDHLRCRLCLGTAMKITVLHCMLAIRNMYVDSGQFVIFTTSQI